MNRVLFPLLALIWLFSPVTLLAATEAIVFVTDSQWDFDDNREIHVMQPDGSNHRMIRTQYPVKSASINAIGDWIVYTTDRRKELRLVHITGKREKVLRTLNHIAGARGPGLVSWSPDGRFVIYTRYYPRNFIGLEIYDTRTRRFTYQTTFGAETSNGSQLTVQRLLWSPDSRHFAAAYIRENVRSGVLFKDFQHTFVASRVTGRTMLDIDTLPEIAFKAYGFASNTELFGMKGTKLSRLNFRNEFERDIVNLASAFGPYNMAMSPDGRFFMVDAIHIGGVTRGKWASLNGTPRGFEFNRNFAAVNTNSLAATFVTPLDDYSMIIDPAATERDRMPNFEWRTLRIPSVFKSRTCWGWVVTKRGGVGDDRIIGTPGPDVIASGAGNDVISSAGGDDVICGGAGNDVMIGGPGDDVLFGDADILDNNIEDIVRSGNDIMRSAGGVDSLYGNNGDDQMNAGAGNDFLDGGDGNDRLDGATGLDSVNGGDGEDQCTNFISAENCE